MAFFAVIEVEQDYDGIYGCNFIRSFTQKEQAEKFVQELRDQNAKSWQNRLKYIDQYVQSIDVPKAKDNYEGWLEFLKRFFILNQSIIHQYYDELSFRTNLKVHLRKFYEVKDPNYKPPEYKGLSALFVVETEEPK